jgi:alanine dehydrogenase
MTRELSQLRQFAECYTTAWCSQDAASVAEFYSPGGSLTVNGGTPAIGRSGIASLARQFMTDFPDLQVLMDSLELRGEQAIYRWTLIGKNTGPGGSGRPVRISGFEEWQIGADDLIAKSEGHFDAADYQRQLAGHGAIPRFLDEHAVRARLSMADLIPAMECALAEFSAGRVQQPVRTVMGFGLEGALFGTMPCYVPSLPALGAKLVTVCGGNTQRGIDTHQAIIVMLNPQTGVAEAIMDGRYITEARTAAVSAVSVKHLARKDAQVLGILGTGVQARSHLEALRLVRDFREVRVWSTTAERLNKFAVETGAQAMPSAEAVVRGAHVVVAVTPSATPVVNNDWVGDGTHVIAVGSCQPDHRELDPALIERARLFVDSREAAVKEAGDVVMGIAEGRWTPAHIEAELGQLPTRKNEGEITVFKSLGLAVEDLFAAHLVLSRFDQ